MFETIKNACIFLLIAQVLLIMVPEESYAKYVRVLVSAILILKLTQPILSWLSGNETAFSFEMENGTISSGVSVEEKEALTQKNRELYENVEIYLRTQLDEEGQESEEVTDGEAD